MHGTPRALFSEQEDIPYYLHSTHTHPNATMHSIIAIVIQYCLIGPSFVSSIYSLLIFDVYHRIIQMKNSAPGRTHSQNNSFILNSRKIVVVGINDRKATVPAINNNHV